MPDKALSSPQASEQIPNEDLSCLGIREMKVIKQQTTKYQIINTKDNANAAWSASLSHKITNALKALTHLNNQNSSKEQATAYKREPNPTPSHHFSISPCKGRDRHRKRADIMEAGVSLQTQKAISSITMQRLVIAVARGSNQRLMRARTPVPQGGVQPPLAIDQQKPKATGGYHTKSCNIPSQLKTPAGIA